MSEGSGFGVDCDVCTEPTEALVTPADAPLTPAGRLRLARCVVQDRWPLRRAAERFQVSVSTAKRWADRFRDHGVAGMVERPSRPCRSPRRTPTRTERRIVKVRMLRRWGPARIASHPGLVASTVHRVLARYGLARLACTEILPDETRHTATAFWTRAHAFSQAHGTVSTSSRSEGLRGFPGARPPHNEVTTSRSASITLSCSSSDNDGYIGSEKISFASRSVTGRDPVAQPRRANPFIVCTGHG